MTVIEPLLAAPSQAGSHGGIVLTLLIVVALIAVVAGLLRAGRSRNRSAERFERDRGPEA